MASRVFAKHPKLDVVAALSLDGVNDYVDLGAATPWENDNVGTISVWFKARSFPTDSVRELLAFGNSLSTSLCAFDVRTQPATFSGARIDFTHASSASAIDGVYGSTTLQTDRWYHAVATSNGSSYSFFLDGKAEVLATWSGTNSGDWFADAPKTGTFGTSIGAVNFGGFSLFFDGLISDARIYNRALTPSEIRQQYEEPWRLISPVGRRTFGFFSTPKAATLVPTGDGTTGTVFEWARFQAPTGSKFSAVDEGTATPDDADGVSTSFFGNSLFLSMTMPSDLATVESVSINVRHTNNVGAGISIHSVQVVKADESTALTVLGFPSINGTVTEILPTALTGGVTAADWAGAKIKITVTPGTGQAAGSVLLHTVDITMTYAVTVPATIFSRRTFGPRVGSRQLIGI